MVQLPDNQYNSPNQTKKLLAFGVVAAAIFTPLFERIAEWIFDAIFWVFEMIANIVAGALFGIVGNLFATGTETFLFFPAPHTIEPLADVWGDFNFIFWALLPVTGAAFFIGMQLFPENEEADVFRFLERSFVAILALIITMPPAAHGMWDMPDIFSLTVMGVNEIGMFVFPDDYNLQFMGDVFNSLMGGLTALGGLAASVIAIALLGFKFAIGMLMTIATFYVVLAMRMLLVYVVYAMMPLLLALWIVDIGPLKYGKAVAELTFKLTAVLLILGVVISGILATTGAIAGGADGSGEIQIGDFDGVDHEDGFIDEDGEGSSGGETHEGGEGATGDPPAGWELALIQMFAWVGGIVLCVALTTSLLGMIISMRGARGTRSRMRQGRRPDAPTGPQTYGGASTAGSGVGGGGGGGTDGFDAGMDRMPEPGTMGGDEGGMPGGMGGAPEPDNPSPTLGDKASHLDDKYMKGIGGKTIGAAKNKKGQIEDGADNLASGASDLGDSAEDKMKEGGKSLGGKIGGFVGNKVGSAASKASDKYSDFVRDTAPKKHPDNSVYTEENADRIEEATEDLAETGGELGEKVGEKLGSAAGTVSGKVANYGVSAIGGAPKAALKGGNLAKRGGKAYGKVFMQPDIGSSIGEAHRIARESPIGKPPGPEQQGADPSDNQTVGPSDMDNQPEQDEFDQDDSEL